MAASKQDKAGAVAAVSSKSSTTPLIPIALHDDPLSKSLAHLRPLLLGGLGLLGFRSLVADPEFALQAALPVVAVIQVAYAIVCLPAVGSQQEKVTKKPRPGEKKRTDAAGPNLVVATILSLLLTVIATPAIHIIFVLFGAPFLDNVLNTLLCSAHFALLGLFPIFYSRGLDNDALLALAGASAPLDETFGALVGALLGAWIGAVPIPLDWDRDWQKWPVTIVVGMYMGSGLVAKLFGMVPFLYGKRLGVSETKQN